MPKTIDGKQKTSQSKKKPPSIDFSLGNGQAFYPEHHQRSMFISMPCIISSLKQSKFILLERKRRKKKRNV